MRPTLTVRSYPPQEATHAHDWHQIVVAVDGALCMQVGGVEGEVDETSFVVVRSDTPHRFRGERTNSFVVLNVPPSAGFAGLPDRLLERLVAAPFLPMDEGLRHLSCYIAHDAGTAGRGALLLDQMAPLLLQALQSRVAERRRLPAALERAVERLRMEDGWLLSVEELAAAAGVSVSGLHALFRDSLGTSPGRYMLERRLDEAERLITGSGLPLAEVALAVGFGDQSALTRSLRRHRGETPGALRRRSGGPAQGFAGPAKTVA